MFSNENFIEQLLLKAMPNMDDSSINLLIEDVKPVLFDRVMTNIANALSEEKLLEFKNIIKNNKSEKEIYDFLNENISQYEVFIAKVYDDFEKMYLKEFKEWLK